MTKQYKNFGELTEEDQNKLFQFWVKNGFIEFYIHFGAEWVKEKKPIWNPDVIYRIPETKPSVNWDHLHKDIVAIAMDGDGKFFGYTRKPRHGTIGKNNHWYSNGMAYRIKGVIASLQPGTCAPEDSLVMRPGVEDE